MGRPHRVRAGSLNRALAIGILAANVILLPTHSARAENPDSNRASPAGVPPGGRTTEIAKEMSLDGQSPPPGDMIVSQIHNALGWQPSHAYTYETGPYTRVVNGSGWSPESHSYHPGQTLEAFQLISRGVCTSGSRGGPHGTGSAIEDGTCTWKYLSEVDYISITGWAFDNRPWKSGTLYSYREYVTSDSTLRTYALQDNSCRSTAAPTGIGSGANSVVVTSDGCHWQYQADIVYSSEKSHIPTETSTGYNAPATIMLHANYEARLWNDREYVAGQNGEASPIRTQDHDDFRREGGVLLGCTSSPCYHLIITTAPGESFHDSLTPPDRLSGYDPSRGVAIRNSLPYRWPHQPAGLEIHDNYVDLIGLQIKSVHGPAVEGMSSFANTLTIRDCILDGGSEDQWTAHAAMTTDTNSVIANSLIISHAPIGVVLKYPGYVLNSTIVTPDRIASSVGIETFNKWVYDNTTVSNTAIFGFAHAVAHDERDTSWSPQSSHNATDAPSGDAGTGPWPYGDRGAATVDVLPGTMYGVTAASAFVKPGSDWRLSPASPLRGAGNRFGSFTLNCDLRHPGCPQQTAYRFDTPDIVGTARPQVGEYDIGAWQSCASAAVGTCTSVPEVRSSKPCRLIYAAARIQFHRVFKHPVRKWHHHDQRSRVGTAAASQRQGEHGIMLKRLKTPI